MALGDKKNILVGAASVFLGGSGADAAPAVVSGTSYRDTLEADAAWTNVGYTQDGLEVATDPSYGEVEVDQLLDAAKIFKDGMGLTVSTTFAEATLENLLIAWGQPADSRTDIAADTTTGQAAYSELEIQGGSLGEAPLERGLIAVGNAPENTANQYGERTYHVYRVLSVDATTVSLSRADASTIPVSFRALPDDSGRYGIVRDRSRVADGALAARGARGTKLTEEGKKSGKDSDK